MTVRSGGSLCQAISGTINESDFAAFNREFEDPQARRMIEKNASVMECLGRLVEKPISSSEKVASAARSAFKPGTDVVQVRPDGFGYVIKVSAAPAGMAPQETKVTAQQAQRALPPEMLQAADQQGAATVTNVQAAPDPLQEQAAPVSQFGLYKVTDASTGKQLVGFVVPSLFDPVTGQMTSTKLFTNGSQYAVQPEIMGSLVGVSHNLPLPEKPEVRGFGVFVKGNEKALIVIDRIERYRKKPAAVVVFQKIDNLLDLGEIGVGPVLSQRVEYQASG
jgi:hypothetical protein